MVVAGSTIGSSLENAKNKLMIVYAQKVLNSAYTNYQTETIFTGYTTKYYSIAELMNDSDYYGGIKIEPDGNSLKYSIALFNSKEETALKMVNLYSTTIDNNPNYLITSELYDSDRTKYDTSTEINETTFIGSNLIDFTKVTDENKYIVSGNGETYVSSENWRYSSYIKIIPNKCYKFEVITKNTSSAGIAWYSEPKTSNYINGINGTNLNSKEYIKAPSNANYIRVSWDIDKNKNWKDTVKLIELTSCPS